MTLEPRPGTSPDRVMTFFDFEAIVDPERFAALERSKTTPTASYPAIPPSSFKLLINPNRWEASADKVRTQVQTGAGFDLKTWRNQPQVFNYSGSSGVFQREQVPFRLPERADATLPVDQRSGPFDVQATAAWRKFQAFNKFYLNTKERLINVEFLGETLETAMDNFRFTWDANDPFHISYSFVLTVYRRLFAQIKLPDTKEVPSVLQRFRQAYEVNYDDLDPATEASVQDDILGLRRQQTKRQTRKLL